MQRQLTRIFSIGFALVWGWIFLNSILRWQYNGLAAAAAGAVLLGGAFAVVRFAQPRIDEISEKKFRIGITAALLLYGVVLGVMGFLLAEVPIMDMETVLQSLPDFLDDGVPQVWGAYYVICNNNLGLALLLTGWFKIMGMFGIAPNTETGIYAGIVLNVLMIFAAVVLVCLLARRILRSNSAVALAFLMCVGFLPFILWAPCFYSDTLSLPFGLLALLLWTYYRKEKQTGKRVLLLVLMAAAAFVGYAVKGSVAVVLIALLIQLFLEKSPKQAALGGVTLLLVFALCLSGYKAWQKSGLLDFSVEDAEGFPIELWFAYGSTGDGNYSDAICQAAKDLPNMDQRRQMLRKQIADNYASYTPVGLADFMTRKASITWGNGLYDAQEFLATPLKANWTHRFILAGQPGYMPMVYYCQAYQFLLMALVLAGAIHAAVTARPGTLTLARIGVFGLVLFLSLWETKARYSFNFAPILILLAAAALWQIAQPRRIGKDKQKWFSAKKVQKKL